MNLKLASDKTKVEKFNIKSEIDMERQLIDENIKQEQKI